MEERLHSTEGLAATFEARLEAAQRTVGALKEGVQGLAAQAGCGTRAVRELLGDGGVTEQNVLQYVSVVEQRVAEVLRVYSGALSRAGRDSDHLQVCFANQGMAHPLARVHGARVVKMMEVFVRLRACWPAACFPARPVGIKCLRGCHLVMLHRACARCPCSMY